MNEYITQLDSTTDAFLPQEILQPNWAGIVLSLAVFGVVLLFVMRQMFGSEPFKKGFVAFKRLPIGARAAALCLMAAVIVYGGTKPGTNEMEQASSAPVAFLRSAGQMASAPAAVEFTESQQLAGFALSAVVTNEAFDLSAPTNAVVHANWLKRGASEDGFWAALDGFPLGTNRHDAVYVSSSGTLSFNRPKSSPTARPMPDGSSIAFLAPLQTVLGIPPEARWNAITNYELQITNSLFWSDVTDSGSARFTWQNALLDRATNAPVSFQVELFPDGDFVYRYDFGKITNYELRMTNHVIGAQNNGGGETALIATDAHACSATNHLCAILYRLDGTNVLSTPLCSVVTNSPKFSLHWTAFGALDPADPDPDGDGLATSDEVLLHHTDPSMPDTDLDGVSDGGELAAGYNPLNPDSDDDGLPDGLDLNPLVWDDAESDADGDGLSLADELLNGLDPAVADNVDTDGDGWADWLEELAGTSPLSPAESPACSEGGATNIFSVAVSVAAPPSAPVFVAVGKQTAVFSSRAPKGTSRTFWVREGVAQPVALYAVADTAVSLTATLGSAWAVFQNPHPVFTRVGTLPGGRAVSSGVIAQPSVAIDPDRLCFHSREDISVSASVDPGTLAGGWMWWKDGEPSYGSGSGVVLAYDDVFFPTWLIFEYQADGAALPRSLWRFVTRCALLDSHPDWLESQELDSLREHPHERYHEGDPTTGEPIQYDLGNEIPGGSPGILVPVNNDDDDASASDDCSDRLMRTPDNDLIVYYPLGRYDGNCCPCPEHQPKGPALSATLQSVSSRLELWQDACKSNAFSGPVFAGQAVYVEGLGESPSSGAEEIAWQYRTDTETLAFTNAFTVLSQRLFADLDFDGDVDEADKAMHPALSPEYGWVIPAATNTYREIHLRTDIDLPGMHVLTLSGGDAFRVWRTASPGPADVPLLVGCQSATNGIAGVFWDLGSPDSVYLEVVGGGVATLTYAFLGTGTASRVVSRATLRMTSLAVASVEIVGAPDDGLVVLNGTPVNLKAEIIPAGYSVPTNEPKWFYQILNSDGSWSDWIRFGGMAFGTNYVHIMTQSGIFRVKAVFSVGGVPFCESVLKRTTTEAYGPGTIGTPDAFGVADTEMQIAIRNAAKGFLGSTAYPFNGVVPAQYGFPEYGNNTYKCNIFVAHRAVQAGANVPAINGTPATYPPLANEWAGTEDTHPYIAGFQNDIEDWFLMTNPSCPQPGMIVAHPNPSGPGHVGIVDYDGNGIGAGTSGTVNKDYWQFLDGTSGFRKYEP